MRCMVVDLSRATTKVYGLQIAQEFTIETYTALMEVKSQQGGSKDDGCDEDNNNVIL